MWAYGYNKVYYSLYHPLKTTSFTNRLENLDMDLTFFFFSTAK